MKTIIILGGSYGGVGTAHRLLKASQKTPALDIKVILVSPSTHLYWNLAAVRAVLPGQLADDKVFKEIAPGFKQYGAGKFEFVIGTAEGVDLEGKKVRVLETGDVTRDISYDTLVLATGSRPRDLGPFKLIGSYEESLKLLHDFQERIKQAEDIVVGGAGATGVEVSGELGFEYGSKKKITLIASGSRILESTPPSVSKTATSQLQNLKVDVKLSTKVQSHIQLPSGRTELSLSDGKKITTDLYIPTSGLIPNSGYLPSTLLNPQGFVVVDEYLRVKGSKDVWAAGDISAVQRPQYMYTEKQAGHVAKNIELSLKGANLVPYKVDEKSMLFATVGKKGGSGHMGNFKFPSFMVAMIKGKTLFTQNLPPTVSGAHY